MKKFADGSKEDINHWFALCRKKQQPYIVIVPKRKYALIEWDYMHFDKAIGANIRHHEREIVDSMGAILKKYRLQNFKFSRNNLGRNLRGVEIEDSVLIAEELYDLFNKYAYQDDLSFAVVD
jgi:hypothetical protein